VTAVHITVLLAAIAALGLISALTIVPSDIFADVIALSVIEPVLILDIAI